MLSEGFDPAIDEQLERSGVQIMKFEAPLFAREDVQGGDKAGHWSVGDVLMRAE